MVDKIDMAMRSAMAAIVGVAPEAPEFPLTPEQDRQHRMSNRHPFIVGIAAVVVLSVTFGWTLMMMRGSPETTVMGSAPQPGDWITVSTRPLIVQPLYGDVAAPDGAPDSLSESPPLTPLTSLDLIGDALVVGGGYNHPELAAVGFTEGVESLLDLVAPLVTEHTPITLHGVAENRIVLSWPALTSQGPGVCLAEMQGNATGAGCGTELPVGQWTIGDGTAFGVYIVPSEVAWVEVSVDGQLVAWQMPRAGAVAVEVDTTPGSEVSVELLSESGSTVARELFAP